jgi:hypothetical protein
VAVPLTAGALLPLLRLLGAVAVMVTLPELIQVATPLELIVAMAGLELAQTRPFVEVSERVVLLLIKPSAANATCAGGVLLAGFGAMVMVRNFGLLPQPANAPARRRTRA